MEYEAKQVLYLPVETLLPLELQLGESHPGVKLEAFITELINDWLARDSTGPVLPKADPAMRGYQWKAVFLPEGTDLRTSHGGKIEFAKVVGDRVVADEGVATTPSEFANRHAKGRNAWRFVWLRFPGDGYWTRADKCRARDEEMMLKRSKT